MDELQLPDEYAVHERDEVRAALILRDLKVLRGALCAGCSAAICSHEALFSIAAGFKNAPKCLDCLAAALGRERDAARDRLYSFVIQKPCNLPNWIWANEQEGQSARDLPACLWERGERVRAVEASSERSSTEIVPDEEWNAGDMACGDLVLELRLRLKALAPGTILRVIARDPGAPADMPAWCGLTGHRLLSARHPVYDIRRKDG